MQAEDITNLINSRIPFDKGTLLRLSEMLEEYPFFQAGRLLYTLNLQANKDTRLSAEIKKTTCYMGDRRKFFYLMEKDFSALFLAETENIKNQLFPDDSFNLIELFLDRKEKKSQKELLSSPDSQMALTDYMSYLVSEEKQEHEPNLVPLQHQEAIDKFISKDATTGIKINLKSKENDASTFTPAIEKEEFGNYFSETLAKIYLKQKKYTKALEIIIKLNLEYPEKSRYFADQIRFLEKLIINAKK